MIILLVDDEQYALEELELQINTQFDNITIYKADNYKSALDICQNYPIDVAFLDVEMPVMNGITLGKNLKELRPEIDIIIVTAYKEYALDALGLYVSDYVLKPSSDEDIKNALLHLRHHHIYPHIEVKCFGNFEVFVDGEIMHFSRSKCKELFAYLIDLQGSTCSVEQLCTILWEDDADIEKHKTYLRQITSDLKKTLKHYHIEEIFIKKRNSYAIDISTIDCDYYRYLKGDKVAIKQYRGEYMSQYSWAYMSLMDEY